MIPTYAKLHFPIYCKNCQYGIEVPNNSVQLTCMYNPPNTASAMGRDMAGNTMPITISMRPIVSLNDFCAFGAECENTHNG